VAAMPETPFTQEELDRAHTQSCPLCRAVPGQPCRSVFGHEFTRVVHFARVEISRGVK